MKGHTWSAAIVGWPCGIWIMIDWLYRVQSARKTSTALLHSHQQPELSTLVRLDSWIHSPAVARPSPGLTCCGFCDASPLTAVVNGGYLSHHSSSVSSSSCEPFSFDLSSPKTTLEAVVHEWKSQEVTSLPVWCQQLYQLKVTTVIIFHPILMFDVNVLLCHWVMWQLRCRFEVVPKVCDECM